VALSEGITHYVELQLWG